MDELKECPFCEMPNGKHDENCWVTLVLNGEAGDHVGEAWNRRIERTCKFELCVDEEEMAERRKATAGEWSTCDIPLCWKCSACGLKLAPVTQLPEWMRHCPGCGWKVVDK